MEADMKNFSEDIDVNCRYCEHAEPLEDGENMLCSLNGVVLSSGCCRRFVYDALKRVPPRRTDAPGLEYVDLDK